jgi:hypothetical protein
VEEDDAFCFPGRRVCLRGAFFEGLISAFSSTIFSTTSREKPGRDDKSGGPFIDPAYFTNSGSIFFASPLL